MSPYFLSICFKSLSILFFSYQFSEQNVAYNQGIALIQMPKSLWQRNSIGVLAPFDWFSFHISPLRLSLCIFGGLLLLWGLIVLSWIDEDDGRHSFGHTGGTEIVAFSVFLFIHLHTRQHAFNCLCTTNENMQVSCAPLSHSCLLLVFS